VRSPAAVAGDTATIEELKLWRIRHGDAPSDSGPTPPRRSVRCVFVRPIHQLLQRARQIARVLQRIDDLEVLPTGAEPDDALRVSGPCDTITSRMVDMRERTVSGCLVARTTRRPNLQRFEFNVGDATMEFSTKEVVSSSSESWERSLTS